MFKKFCKQIWTKVAFASVYQSQTKGAVERVNAFDVGDLVLLWIPGTGSSGKLKSKWDGQYT
jgi:hypothetical protein